MHQATPAELSLRERKHLRVRDSIIDAAFALFREHGFTSVTVTDIAAHADVGRTTFFRYFGDKQEVVFADEQSYMDMLAQREQVAEVETPEHLWQALAQLKVIVVQMCEHAIRDRSRFDMHEQLLQETAELQARDNTKLQNYAAAMEKVLLTRGASPIVANLAANVALACYRTGRQTARNTSVALTVAVGDAFDRIGDLRAG